MRPSIRLARQPSVAGQAGGATTLGVVLTALGGGTVFALRHLVPAGPNDWLFYTVGGGFLLVGLVMLVLGIKMSLMIRLPETIVEVDRMPVRAGQPFRVTVRQAGPIRLASLRLNLVGEQLTKRDVWRTARGRCETDRRLIHQSNVLDLGEMTIARGEVVARQAEVTVPVDVTLADIEGDATVIWRLEIWGRVRGWVNFGHPFVIQVSGGANRRQTRRP